MTLQSGKLPAIIPSLVTPTVPRTPTTIGGFDFTNYCWEGEGASAKAFATARRFERLGHKTGVHAGARDKWNAGKKEELAYFKLWVRHPTDPLLYMWFRPASETTWFDNIDLDTATWFEFTK